MGPRDQVLHGVPDPPWEGAILGKWAAHWIVKYRDTLRPPVWKRLNQSWCRLDCGLTMAQGIMS